MGIKRQDVWMIGDEVNHRGSKCPYCAGDIRIGHHFIELYNGTIVHQSCQDRADGKEEPKAMTDIKELKKLTLKEMINLYNGKVPEDKQVKSFKDRNTAYAAFKALDKAEKKAAKGTIEKKPRDSKMGRIRLAFQEKPSYTLDELMEISKFDKANLMCAMSIFKNPQRTKPENLLVTEYDKATKTYKLAETQAAA